MCFQCVSTVEKRDASQQEINDVLNGFCVFAILELSSLERCCVLLKMSLRTEAVGGGVLE